MFFWVRRDVGTNNAIKANLCKCFTGNLGNKNNFEQNDVMCICNSADECNWVILMTVFVSRILSLFCLPANRAAAASCWVTTTSKINCVINCPKLIFLVRCYPLLFCILTFNF